MTNSNKELARKYSREWVAKRRYIWFKDKTCKFCNSIENLELHHLDPKLKKSHAIWSWSKEKRDEELEKCIVLCRDCHMKETIKQLTKQITHGTHTKYANGCRCNLCRKGHTDYMRTYKKMRDDLVDPQVS